MPIHLTLSEPEGPGQPVTLRCQWNNGYQYQAQAMDEDAGRFLLAFFREDPSSTERGDITLEFPSGNGSFNGSEH